MRLFLAVELPDELLRSLAAVRNALASSSSGWRWVRPEGVHLTLRFLGEVAPQADRRARSAWREAANASSAFTGRLEGTGRFPPSGRPRVLWVGVRSSPSRALVELADRVEQAARAQGFDPETRAFRPHLTLARAARGARPRLPDPLPAPPAASFAVDRLTLFESRLHPQGARYTPLDHFPLGAGAAI